MLEGKFIGVIRARKSCLEFLRNVFWPGKIRENWAEMAAYIITVSGTGQS